MSTPITHTEEELQNRIINDKSIPKMRIERILQRIEEVKDKYMTSGSCCIIISNSFVRFKVMEYYTKLGYDVSVEDNWIKVY